MRSPAVMDVVQIETTNACVHACSNCTRFCGHHKKTFFMEPDTFRKAVDSMKGFGHCLGVMGGEPTLHPRFADLCDYIRDNFPESRPHHVFTGPSRNFVGEVDEMNLRLKKDTIRGLFSSLGPSYYRHFEKIQDTFGFQCLNDHMYPSMHGGLLITRRELGIPDDEWFKLRDNCWVQNLWSASITPKGAFFCEIAASLDMLLDGPGGWPIEPGWWRREPADFGEQLQWCELCSAALAVPKSDAREEKDDASPEWVKRLETIQSPKLRRGGVKPFDVSRYRAEDYAVTNHHRPYLADKTQRMAEENRAVYPRDVKVVAADSAAFPSAASRGSAGEWILLIEKGDVPARLVADLERWVFNPGCVYVDAGAGMKLLNTAAAALGDEGVMARPESRYHPGKVVGVEFAKLR